MEDVRDTTCTHMLPRPGGECSGCGETTCRIGLDSCLCAVGYPYDLRCAECRDRPKRVDEGYCVCVPPRIPPRDVLSHDGLGRAGDTAEAARPETA